jgi:L-ascorbate metabolism protein UlaG (beta-lactamase superfamily)
MLAARRKAYLQLVVAALLAALVALSGAHEVVAAKSKPAPAKEKSKPAAKKKKKKKRKKPPKAQPAPLPRETIDARIKILGAKNVDAKTGAVRKDRVIFSWFGTANFVAAFNGQVVIFNAYVRRGYDLRQVDTSVDELARLKPKFIFLGHAHYDHAIDSGEIALKTGAKVVGLPSHCAQVKEWAALQGNDPSGIDCITAMDQDAPLGTTLRRDDLLDGVPVTIVRHLHTPYTPVDKGAGQTNLDSEGGPEYPCPQEPQWEGFSKFPGTAQEVKNIFLNAVGVGQLLIPNSDGGVIMYQLRVGKLTVTFNDSQGAIDFFPEVREALEALPPSDIEIGSLAANVQHNTNCLHDVRRYWEALRPKVFVPSHHDAQDPTQPVAAFYKPFLAEQAGRMPADKRPCLQMIEDPQHYLNPEVLTWDTSQPAECNPQLVLRAQPPQGNPNPNYELPPGG